ncbi:calcium-binding protein [Phaeobacter gallaeciensis]|uniref:calcium-binding protein n=1 Tax=Phaeobacter gallaeciensis TaxID=60890 RepID=UPI00237F7E3A|nr:calcium-binding protein [Phaeobacter gallaeciensis]MDE4306158.1 calcium-binding protein [Phaeobacter gallaeciensis]MDE4310580.1 calcium-binding protein [Phaeobacter gallaeciensis]MDE4315040.1 calcium-binding protein [Phaeobacter gallaeciensis]MDE4319483.1 calcium-binding protein [Phaeobacter gallaeciensis]MDE4323863.1 calcium-binding protein [Phaeobacter gallaeciensis]
MTTYSMTGFAVLRSSILGEEDVIRGVETGIDLSLYVPDSTTTIRYTNAANPDDPNQPLADIRADGGIGYIEGGVLDEDEASVLQARWSDGGTIRTTTVLVMTFFEAEVDGYSDVDADAIFVLGGDPLPSITTRAQWNAFEGSLQSIGPATGSLAPGQDIPLTSFFASSTENDLITGSDGNDTLIGGPGNDTINPGDNEDTDFIQPGTGRDRVIFSDLSRGYVELDHSDLDAGITAEIDGNANAGLVDKGGNGRTRLVDVQNPILAGADIGGLGVVGTDFNDIFRVTSADGGWLSLAGHSGNDRFVIGESTGAVRLDYRSADSGVVANLGRGRVTDDGMGGADRIAGDGKITEIRTGMYDDKVTGSGRNESFILMGGDDTVNGKGGYDRLRYDQSGVDAVEANLGRGEATGTWNGAAFSHSIRNIEHVRGSRAGDDTLLGNRGDNRFDGRGGDDTLKGQGGNDILNGENGRDKLIGGGGRDTLDGGGGNDLLIGNRGGDTFVFSEGRDTVKGFGGADKIDLSSADGIRGFTDLSNNHLSEANGNVIITDNDGDSMALLNRDISDLSADNFLF